MTVVVRAVFATVISTTILMSCTSSVVKSDRAASRDQSQVGSDAQTARGALEQLVSNQLRLAEHRNDYDSWIHASDLCLQVDRLDDAGRAIFRAAQTKPQSMGVYAQLLRLGARIGVAVDESAIFPDGLTAPMSVWRFWDSHAMALLAKGQFGRAEREAERAVMLSDGHRKALRTLTIIKQARIPLRIAAKKAIRVARARALEEKLVARAVMLCIRAQSWTLAIKLLDDFMAQASTDARMRMSRVYSQDGAQTIAAALLSKRLQRAPNNFLTRYQLATVHRAQRNWIGLLNVLSDFQQGMPLWNRVLIMRAEAETRMGRFDEAARLFADLRSSNSRDRHVVTQLVYALYRARLYARMRSEATIARSQWHDDAELNFLHALSVGETDGQKAGIGAMEALLKRLPNHANAQNYVAYALADEGRDLKKSELLIQAALRSQPQNAAFIDTQGWLSYRQNRLQEAYSNLRRAATLRPENGEIQFHLAVVQARLGQSELAKQRLNLALHLADNEKERAKYTHEWTIETQN
ncbi:MAG: tetratricopeptide repeat protein [Myxococcota bacterium]|nr:tetratricopeptide repeat protein [Myxococcota bacterium]